MELKASLKDYTEPEFEALVNRIWAVDLPKQDHDRLINHFDRIVGHPKGADLLFYSEDEFNVNSSGLVMVYVKYWYHQQGLTAFKGEVAPTPYIPLSHAQIWQQRAALSLAGVQKVIANVAASQQGVEASLSLLEQQIDHLQAQENMLVGIREREVSVRALEVAEYEARVTMRQFEFLKSTIELTRDTARRDLSSARSEQALWQSVAQQISATYERYTGVLNTFNQRFSVLQAEAEALLVIAQARLISLRDLMGAGPGQAPALLVTSLAFAQARPAILLEGALAQPLKSHWVALQKSIRSAVAEFIWQITSESVVHRDQYAAVLRFEYVSRAETERYGLSFPLAELLPIEGQDWQGLATSLAEVDTRFRINSGTYTAPPGMFRGLKQIQTLLQIAITPTNGSKVRVRSAIWDEHLNAFSFTADGTAPVTVSWLAPVTLENTPDLTPASQNRLGFLLSPPVPLLETFSDIKATRFDDYVVVFPADSGLDPLYVMFRDRREYPV
ncbi:MAG: bacteriocin immunity protein [Pseudomonas sp.]